MDQKKVAQLPPFSTTLVAPDPKDAASTVLELDELWSFVLKKANRSWIWIALCRKTRQVVAYAIGDRSKETGSVAKNFKLIKMMHTLKPYIGKTGKRRTVFI